MSMPDITFEKGLPASIDAEKSILGAILLDNDAYNEASGKIHATDFALSAHQRIFARMSHLFEVERAVDIVTLSEELGRNKELQAIGGNAYLASLTEGLPWHLSISEYLGIVKSKSCARKVIAICSDAITRSADQFDEACDVAGNTANALEAVLSDLQGSDDGSVAKTSIDALNSFLSFRSGHIRQERSYGHAKLDEFTGGMRNGQVTVIGARSGVGKTSLMCQAAERNCAKGIPVHLFSLEQKRDEILWHLWSIVSGVPYMRIFKPWLANEDDSCRVQQAAAEIVEWPLRIHDKSDLDINQIVSLARTSIRRHGTQIIAVDYAQNVEGPGKDERARVQNVSRRLTKMIKHEPASLMLFSQLRKIDRESYSKPPHISDLRETGQLENDAHTVILLHRPWDDGLARIADHGEFLLPKQRFGETGALQVEFNRRTVIFE